MNRIIVYLGMLLTKIIFSYSTETVPPTGSYCIANRNLYKAEEVLSSNCAVHLYNSSSDGDELIAVKQIMPEIHPYDLRRGFFISLSPRIKDWIVETVKSDMADRYILGRARYLKSFLSTLPGSMPGFVNAFRHIGAQPANAVEHDWKLFRERSASGKVNWTKSKTSDLDKWLAIAWFVGGEAQRDELVEKIEELMKQSSEENNQTGEYAKILREYKHCSVRYPFDSLKVNTVTIVTPKDKVQDQANAVVSALKGIRKKFVCGRTIDTLESMKKLGIKIADKGVHGIQEELKDFNKFVKEIVKFSVLSKKELSSNELDAIIIAYTRLKVAMMIVLRVIDVSEKIKQLLEALSAQSKSAVDNELKLEMDKKKEGLEAEMTKLIEHSMPQASMGGTNILETAKTNLGVSDWMSLGIGPYHEKLLRSLFGTEFVVGLKDAMKNKINGLTEEQVAEINSKVVGRPLNVLEKRKITEYAEGSR